MKTFKAANVRIKRLDAYKKGSELLGVIYCPVDQVARLEADVIKQFRRQFTQHPDGREYFQGNPVEMLTILYQTALSAMKDTPQSHHSSEAQHDALVSSSSNAITEDKSDRMLMNADKCIDAFIKSCIVSNQDAGWFTIKEASVKWKEFLALLSRKNNINQLAELLERDLKRTLTSNLKTICHDQKKVKDRLNNKISYNRRGVFCGFALLDIESVDVQNHLMTHYPNLLR